MFRSIQQSVLFAALIWMGFSSQPGKSMEQNEDGFRTIGIYGWTTSRPELVPFLKACGYNNWQFIDTAWAIPPSEHEAYYAQMAAGIQELHREGFKVFGIISSNMVQNSGTENPEGYMKTFPISDAAARKERLEFVRLGVAKLKEADGFVFCAGDPGADHSPGSNELAAVEMASHMRAIVSKEAPQADFIFNAWSIAAWGPPLSAFEATFWDQETKCTKNVASLPHFIGPEVGIEFPMHNYYRALAKKCYLEAGLPAPELYPQQADIAALRERGTKHIVGWPYFLIDECDDGYSGGTWGQSQCETRYIHQLIATGHRIGLDGMIGNISMAGGSAELVNLFAFAQFCRDRSATPVQAIRGFAEIVAEKKSVEDLVQVLMFIENHSTAQQFLPAEFRLPNFSCEINDPRLALQRLATVIPKENPRMPLPETAVAYIRRLGNRLEGMTVVE